MASKAKISKKDSKRIHALTIFALASAVLVSIFYISTKLIAMNTPTAPDQSNAAEPGNRGGKPTKRSSKQPGANIANPKNGQTITDFKNK